VILDHHPDFVEYLDHPRLKKLPDLQHRAIGYWWSEYQPDLPKPQDYVDTTWDPVERDAVIAYLEAAETVHSWLGPSRCRFCNEWVGTTCLSDGTFVWPEGLPHYLREHGVRVPQEFIDHVLGGRE